MKRSLYNLSRTEITTWDPGEAIVANFMEICPGDSIQQKTTGIIRALPLLAPVLHEVEIKIDHVFIPTRIIWSDFEDFISGGDDGLNASTFPTIDFSGSPVAKGDLANYLGLPVGYNTTASALPFRCYSLWWNDHVYDEELQTELVVSTDSGTDSTTNTTLKNVNWARDRFTGSNANEQLGSAISLPLGTSANIFRDGADDAQVTVEDGAGGTARELTANTSYVQYNSNAGSSTDLLKADLTNATAATINELREAIALQKFAEMRQIYGSTYEKMLKHDYGVSPRDHRMQNTEVIARGRGILTFSEVLATAETGTSVDVGDMKGHGIAALRSNKYRKFFPEFGYLMTVVCVRPKPMYSQGIDRLWIKTTNEDFFNPHLQHMGMQAIENREVKYNHSTPTATFAYEPRFNEYRKSYNSVRGDFVDSSMNHWHFGRDLSGDPALNSTFITCSPTQRVFAQSTTDNLLGMFRHSIQARRLIKKSVKPVGLI